MASLDHTETLLDTSSLSDSMRYALGMVETMGSHGLTALPIKPTKDMLLAGARAAGISVEEAWKVYTAMVQAAD